jgi:hypothetical protein
MKTELFEVEKIQLVKCKDCKYLQQFKYNERMFCFGLINLILNHLKRH